MVLMVRLGEGLNQMSLCVAMSLCVTLNKRSPRPFQVHCLKVDLNWVLIDQSEVLNAQFS